MLVQRDSENESSLQPLAREIGIAAYWSPSQFIKLKVKTPSYITKFEDAFADEARKQGPRWRDLWHS